MFDIYDDFDLQEDFFSEDGLDFDDNLTLETARDAAKVMSVIVSLRNSTFSVQSLRSQALSCNHSEIGLFMCNPNSTVRLCDSRRAEQRATNCRLLQYYDNKASFKRKRSISLLRNIG